MKHSVFVLLLTIAVFQQGAALQCWTCSSDILRNCGDPFNTSEIIALRNGGYYNLQQNSNQRQYGNNQNFNPSYNPNFNPNYNSNYNNRPNNRNYPVLETCDENAARISRMRPVCMKEVLRGGSYNTIVRRCSMIPFEQYVGSCQRAFGSGLPQEYCETCEYDGCNSATSLKLNFLVSVLSVMAGITYIHL